MTDPEVQCPLFSVIYAIISKYLLWFIIADYGSFYYITVSDSALLRPLPAKLASRAQHNPVLRFAFG